MLFFWQCDNVIVTLPVWASEQQKHAAILEVQ